MIGVECLEEVCEHLLYFFALQSDHSSFCYSYTSMLLQIERHWSINASQLVLSLDNLQMITTTCIQPNHRLRWLEPCVFPKGPSMEIGLDHS